MSDHDFFKVLGYLASPNRDCKLDAEMPARAQNGFESSYAGLTGITAQPDNHNYYILHEGADKWGVELRIYFNAEFNNILSSIQGMVVTPRPGTDYNRRINDNDFIWRLIEYGFLLSDTQDEHRIRGRVPPQFLADFNIGYQIP